MEAGAEDREVLMATLCIHHSIALGNLGLWRREVQRNSFHLREMQEGGMELTWKKAPEFSRCSQIAGISSVTVVTSWSVV